MPIDQAKLKALKAQGPAKVGGQRTVVKAKSAPSKATEVIAAVNRLGAKPIPASEVWMFKDDNTILQFNKPKVVAAVQSGTWAVQGKPVSKSLTECLPQAFQHLGLENMGALQQLMAAMGGMGGAGGMPGLGGMGGMPGLGGMGGMPGLGGMDMASMMQGLGGMPGMDEVPNFDEATEDAPDLVE